MDYETAVSGMKAVHPSVLPALLDEGRRSGETYTLDAGTFNPYRLHHRHFLEESARNGTLVVATNTDPSLDAYRRSQGREDFIFPLGYRAHLLSKSPFVRYVTWYDDINAAGLIASLRPEKMAHGPDYSRETLNPEELQVLESIGTELLFLNGATRDTRPIARFIEEFERQGGREFWVPVTERLLQGGYLYAD